MTRLRNQAEARERELKKMLREVEVSNLDIETRLHQLDQRLENGVDTKQRSPKDQPSGDKRLNRVEPNDAIGSMVEMAIEDDISTAENLDGEYLDRLEDDKQATIKAAIARDGEVTSTHSSQDNSESKGIVKVWKEYLWSGTGTRKTSRASSIMSNVDEDQVGARPRAGSGPSLRRKGLNDTLFQPPETGGDGAASIKGPITGLQTDKSRSSSMTSWTLRMFAGNPQASKEQGGQESVRGRSTAASSGTVKGTRDPSHGSVQTTSSARASLMKVNTKVNTKASSQRKPMQPLTFGPSGTVKSSSQSISSIPPGSPGPTNESNNLGPVELDAIHPHGSRPPTLTPSYQNIDDATDYLTDRFGFIYDQRRRKKEAEALTMLNATKGKGKKEFLGGPKDNIDAESINSTNELQISRPDTPTSTDERIEESKPTRKWQDYLKLATFPTELLSHTPSTGNIMTISNPDIKKSLQRTPTFGDSGDYLPSPAIPSAASITAGNAEIAKPIVSTPTTPLTPHKGDFEPVKALLAQLTELHDNLQREKTVKWNEFMRKVRAERKREGESGQDSRSKAVAMPEALLGDGEVIGIATLGNKGKVGRAKYKEFKSLVLAGIPVSLRAKVWAECSGASALRIPGYYADLVTSGTDDPIIISQIQMDINRTLTDNVFFRRGPGVAKLSEVLLAYSRRNPEVGYCQGMNLITASLLLIMPTAEDAFWVLVSMIENILPRHYYDNSLMASRADQQVLRQYVSDLLPRLSAHLDNLSIELEALTFQWFLSLFTDCLSAEALYRVWDVLLCCKDEEGNGGSTFLFQVALALLKLNETQLIACESPGEVYAYLGGQITNHAISIDGLIRASEGLKSLVRRSEVEERRAKWVAVEVATIEEREKIKREVADKSSVTKKSKMQGDARTVEEEALEFRAPMAVEE